MILEIISLEYSIHPSAASLFTLFLYANVVQKDRKVFKHFKISQDLQIGFCVVFPVQHSHNMSECGYGTICCIFRCGKEAEDHSNNDWRDAISALSISEDLCRKNTVSL